MNVRIATKTYTAALFFVVPSVALLLAPAAKASIHAYEAIADAGVVGKIIEELTGFDADGLVRARGYLNPFSADIETDDATIISENSVSPSFGGFNSAPVSYTHHLDWLAPPANGVYTSATLHIAVVGGLIAGGPTTVYVDTFDLGSLNSGFLLSLTDFGIDVSLLSDDMLSVEIDKGVLGRRKKFDQKFKVVASKIVVKYDPIPEPTSVLVWSGMVGVGLCVLRKRLVA